MAVAKPYFSKEGFDDWKNRKYLTDYSFSRYEDEATHCLLCSFFGTILARHRGVPVTDLRIEQWHRDMLVDISPATIETWYL
jgi:hypothetical protein